MNLKHILLISILLVNSAKLCACSDSIKLFYTTYLMNILEDNSKNEILCKKYLTEELVEKVSRLINVTGADPIIRAQDTRLDAVETLNIKTLCNDWYLVSYYWDKENIDTLIEIPLKTTNENNTCRITYITPSWKGSQFGDQLLTSKDKETIEIKHDSTNSFIKSFYNAYTDEYYKAPKDLLRNLILFHDKYLSKKALLQYKNAKKENQMDGYTDYDILIDNYDYDIDWNKNIRFIKLEDMNYLITYKGNNKEHNIVISIIKEEKTFMINNIQVVNNKQINQKSKYRVGLLRNEIDLNL